MNNILIEKFEKHLKANGKSSNTVKSYINHINNFLQFTKKNKNKLQDNIEDINILDVSINFIKNIVYEDIDEYNSFLLEKCKNSNSSRCNKLSAVKAFLKYLVQIKLLEYNVMSNYKLPKIKKKNPVYMTEIEIAKFLKVLKESDSFRDYVIFYLFLNSGLRISELVNLNIEDIEDIENKKKIKIIGKGNQEGIIYLNQEIKDVLIKYMTYRLSINDNKIKEGHKNALFLSKIYQRISPRTIQKNMKIYLEKAGLSKELTPHKLRHSFATLMIKKGTNIRIIQEILRHKNISTTQIYTHVEKEELQEAVNNLHI